MGTKIKGHSMLILVCDMNMLYTDVFVVVIVAVDLYLVMLLSYLVILLISNSVIVDLLSSASIILQHNYSVQFLMTCLKLITVLISSSCMLLVMVHKNKTQNRCFIKG